MYPLISSNVILRVVFSGGTLAFLLAAMVAHTGEPAYGLMLIVPVPDTDPGYADDRWGENIDALGLTPLRLLSELRKLFGRYLSDRTDWIYNPSCVPSHVFRNLPTTTMVLATLDPLYQSQVRFRDRLVAESVNVECLEVNGLHMAKDLDEVTEAGRQVRQWMREKHGVWKRRTTAFKD